MDADFSHDPKYLPALVAAAVDCDLVVGSRYLNGISVVNWPLRRLILSTFANRYIRAVTGLAVRDCTGGFRCWRRDALARIPLGRIVSDGYAFMVEMLFEAARQRCRIGEVPIVFVERRMGTSKLSGGVLARVACSCRGGCGCGRCSGAEPGGPRDPAAPEREVVVMVATSYPRFPGRHDRHVHGADRARRGRTRPRGPHGDPVAPAPGARGAPSTASGSTRSATRRPEAERVRLRRGAARRRQPAALGLGGRAARPRGGLAEGTRGRPASPAPPSSTDTGWSRAAPSPPPRAPRLPMVVSLHGSDVYVAERSPIARRVARAVFRHAGWMTACSEDLRDSSGRARRRGGALRDRSVRRRCGPLPPEPGSARRVSVRSSACGEGDPLLFAAGRFVRKKGFEYLIDAVARLAPRRGPRSGSSSAAPAISNGELRDRAAREQVAGQVIFPGRPLAGRGGRLPRSRRPRGRPLGARRCRQRGRAAQRGHGGAGVRNAARGDHGRRHRRSRARRRERGAGGRA